MAGFGLVCAEVRLMLDELTLHTSAWAEEAARTHDHRTANHKALAAAGGGLDFDPLGLNNGGWLQQSATAQGGAPAASEAEADAVGCTEGDWPADHTGGQCVASVATSGAASGVPHEAAEVPGPHQPSSPSWRANALASPGIAASLPAPPVVLRRAGSGTGGMRSSDGCAAACAAGPPTLETPGVAAVAARRLAITDDDAHDGKEAFDTVTPLGSGVGPSDTRRGLAGLYGQQAGSMAGSSFHRAADSDMGGDGKEAICAAFDEVAGDAASAHGRHHADEVAGVASARADALLQGFQAAAHYSFRVTEAFSLPVGGAVLAGFVLLLVTVVDILEWDHDSLHRPHNAGAAAAEAWLYVTLIFLVVWILVPLFNVGLVAERFHVFQRDASMSIVTSPAFRPLSHAEKALLATFFTGAHPAIHLLGVEVTLESLKEVVLMLVAAMTVLLKYKFDLEIEV